MAYQGAGHGRNHCPGGSDPIPCMGAVEWVNITASNAALGTSLTAIEFSAIDGFYDSSTFSIANGDVIVHKAGFYSFSHKNGGWSLTNDVISNLIMELSVISGSAGIWSGALVGSSGFVSATELLNFDNVTDNYQQIPAPYLFTYVSWDTNDTFPVTVQLKAYVEEDGVGVSHSEGDFRLFVVRHGGNYGDV